jgi:Protein of unknown function (DUF3168)
MAVEGQRVASFVWSALTSDAGAGGVNTLLGGRIYRDQVPQAAALPAATVTLVSATDSNTLGGLRAFDVALVDVRVVGAGANYAPINPIADRIDAVLQNRSGTNGGVQIVELRRDQVLTFVENEAGAAYSHIVATYRTEAYPAPS